MRLTSEIFCAALVRAAFSDGGFAVIANHGASEAGAIFITQRLRGGALNLLGPAPQSVFMQDEAAQPAADTRKFELLLQGASEMDVDQRLKRERRYDPDIWVVELETDQLPQMISLVDA